MHFRYRLDNRLERLKVRIDITNAVGNCMVEESILDVNRHAATSMSH
jgi:hypothetical protein